MVRPKVLYSKAFRPVASCGTNRNPSRSQTSVEGGIANVAEKRNKTWC